MNKIFKCYKEYTELQSQFRKICATKISFYYYYYSFELFISFSEGPFIIELQSQFRKI